VNHLESDWLTKALHHDDEAFTHLVEAYQAPVYNLCYRMLGDSGEAEDAAQESFWRAYQSIHRYDPQRSFITWLLSIAAHYCIDQIRKRRMSTLSLDMLPEGDIADTHIPSPESSYARREEQLRMRRLLQSLNAEDRAAIIMSYWYDLSDQEIGEALKLSVSAVKSRLFRARRELARMWQIDQPAPAVIPQRRHHESPAF
jgi:RNA polymerase sigma-70 factor (ECF subfamily)